MIIIKLKNLNIFFIDMQKRQHPSSNIVKVENDSVQLNDKRVDSGQKFNWKEDSFSSNQKKCQNTLSLLTKNFIALIKNKQNMTIDSNDAAKQLGIQKRRIYDITNVLEGIGYVQKIHKNKLRWVGGAKDPKVSSEINNLDEQILSLEKKQLELTSKIEYLEKRIKNDFNENKQLNYLRLSYFKEILGNMTHKPKRAIIVKASKDTTLISNKNQLTEQTEIEIYFGKQTKGQIYYVQLNQKDQKKQQKIKNQPNKKVKTQQF